MSQKAKAPTRVVLYGRRQGRCVEIVIDRIRPKKVPVVQASTKADIFQRLPLWYRL